MISEIGIMVIVAVSGFGALTVVRRSVSGMARVWLSIPTGFAMYLVVALLLIVVTGTLSPVLALAVTTGVGAVFALAGIGATWDRQEVGWAALTVGLVVVTVILTRIWHLARLSPDSLRYLLASTDLVRPNALTEMHRADLIIRQIGLPSLHALSTIVDRRYLASIGPLFGVSGLGLFVWLTWHFTVEMDARRRRFLVVAAALFLGTSNRLVYDAFYVNAHIEMAVYLLIAIAGTWLAVARDQTGWALPAGLALSVTLLLRPEAPLMVAIVLVTVGASRATWPVRVNMALPSILVISIWYGVALWQHANSGDVISLMAPVFGSLVAVFGATAVVATGGLRRAKPLVGYSHWVMLVGLALLVGLFAAREPDILIVSIGATFRNLTYNGLWLLTWVAAIVLLLVALIVHRLPDARLWTVPIVGFGLLFWLLPLLRDGPWRVGAGDSGNRILAHILAVVVAFLLLAAVEPSSSRDDSKYSGERL